MTRRYALVAPVSLAVLVVVWWATRFIDRGDEPTLDSLLYFLPTYASTWERFRAGVVPLWNPYQLCGIPWIGTLQGGTFYPLHLPYGFLPLNVAGAVGGVLHLIIGALGMAAFIRRLGLGRAAALLAAVVFALRGRVSEALAAPNLLEAIAWLPIGAVALVDLARAPSRRAVALLAAATGLSFLAGYPQPTVYMVYTWGSLFVALLIQARPSLREAGERLGAVAVALALGGAIAAIQLLPALELIGVGTRAPDALDERTMFPMGPVLTPGLVAIGWHSISGSFLAFGLLTLSLGAAAVVAPGRRVLGWWALAFSVVVTVVSLGHYAYAPLFDLYLMLPAMRLFRNPSRVLIVLDFSVAVGAALGLSAVLGSTESGSASRRRRVGAVALMALALVGLLELVRRGWAPNAAALVPAFGTVAAAAMVALLAVTNPRRRALLGGAIAAVAVVEIAFNPWSSIRLPYRASAIAPYDTFAADFRRLAALAGSDRVWRFAGIQAQYTLKLSTWHRLRSLTDYEPVNLQRQSDFFTYFRDGSTVSKRPPWLFSGDIATTLAPPDGTAPATRRRLLDLAAVRWIVLGRGALLMPTVREFATTAGFVKNEGNWNVLVLENRAALPRAFVTYRTYTAPGDPNQLLATLASPGFDPLVASFVEGPPPFAAAGDAPPRGHPATFVEDGETAVELEVRLERPGLVVLADSYYPGWRATVDGVEAPILATNHLFRGVAAAAGTHRVRFTYEPASVRIGAAVTFAGLAVLAWLVVTGTRARRRDDEGDPAVSEERSAVA